ncbi:MAG: acyltransferase family protein [Eubacteriales bacterium]
MTSTKTIVFLNYLRVFSCILIILGHIAANQFEAISPRSFSWQCMNMYDCLAILGVPLFVMISGSVMLSSSKSASISYILKKACKLYFLYYSWGFFYNYIDYSSKYTFSLSSFKEEVVLDTLVISVHYHLWFLPMLITLYLMTPIVKSICTSRKLLEYSLILYCIFVLFFPTLFQYDFPYRTIVQATFNRLSFPYFGQYLGYYLLGYYLSHYTNNWKKNHYSILSIGSVLCIVTIICLCGYDGYVNNTHSVIVNTPLSIFHIIACSGIFLLFKNRINQVGKATPLIDKINGLSLGVYFIHPLVIAQLSAIGITTLSFMPLLSIPVLTLLVFAVSILFVWLLSKIPIIQYLF